MNAKGDLASLAYTLLVAQEIHLSIKLHDRQVGYEHESEGATFIERVLENSSGDSHTNLYELCPTLKSLQGLRESLRKELSMRFQLGNQASKVSKVKLHSGTPSLALLLAL